MLAGFRQRGFGAGASVALALIALALQILVPPGFMVSSGPTPTVVICTGHGSISGPLDDHGQQNKTPKDKSDHACPFAGHGGAPLAPSLQSAAIGLSVVDVARPTGKLADLAPGRGLAAPPPPSHAPPQHSI